MFRLRRGTRFEDAVETEECMKKAVVLLSGGMDSAVTLYFAKSKGFKPHCLIFDYGQRHKKEIDFAKKLARKTGAEYHVLKISLPWKNSALLDKNIEVPEKSKKGIPATYVPARNTIFLSFGLSYAEAIKAGDIFIGANTIDFSGYPDCRPEYFQRFNQLLKRATKKKNISIKTPLLHKNKRGIVELGKKLNVPFELTWSCYKGGKKPCGRCDACRLRHKGFE